MEVSAGSPLPPFVVGEVSAEKMKTMALLLRDPNPIHWDPEAVSGLGMGERVINQGPTNMAYVVNMLFSWAGDPSLIRNLEVRFLDNVFAGEHVEAGGSVTEVRREDGVTLADCEVWLDAGERRVLAGTATVVVNAD